MEFRYRAVDRRPPQPSSFFPLYHPPPPPCFNFFAEQRFQGGGFGITTDFRRNDNYFHTSPSITPDAAHWELEKTSMRRMPLDMEVSSEMNDFRRNANYFHTNPSITREAAQWELEKISMRRMLLEMEVRSEMLIEREVYIRRMAENAGFEGVSSCLVYNNGGTFPERIGRLLEEGRGFHSRGLTGDVGEGYGFHSAGLTGNLGLECVGSRTTEIKALAEVDKDKVIVMAKPDPSTSGTKRKAVSPPASAISELLKKKPREEWSCAICQVSATNERGLKEHLEGKRHKAKEKGLLTQKMVKAKPLPKNSGKPSKSSKTAGSNKVLKGSEMTLQVNINKEVLEQNTQNEEEAKQNLGARIETKQPIDSKKNGVVEATAKPKKVGKFKFWCEMCQKGGENEKVMNFHNSGKKHKSKLAKLAQNSRIDNAVPTTLPLPESSQKANIVEGVVEAANKIKEELVSDMTDAPGSASGENQGVEMNID